jgi:signal transduction histidine kinase
LTAILGETEIALSRSRSTAEYVATLTKIASEAERLDILTRNLLNLAQADFEISEANREEIRIDEFLWEIRDYYDKTEYGSRILFHILQLPENPDSTIIYEISNLLKTAIINLIDNACKFSGNQIVDVSLEVDDTAISLTVSDKGIGVPEDEIDSLFHPFFRASNAYSYKGSGIGLSLAGKIIGLHGGKLNFHSSPGKGSEVEIVFNSVSGSAKQ